MKRDRAQVGGPIGPRQAEYGLIDRIGSDPIADRTDDRPRGSTTDTDGGDRRRFHVERKATGRHQSGHLVRFGGQPVVGDDRAARLEVAERRRVVLRAGPAIDDPLRHDHVTDCETTTDPSGDADHDHMIGVMVIEQPLGRGGRRTETDAGQRGHDPHRSVRSRVGLTIR